VTDTDAAIAGLAELVTVTMAAVQRLAERIARLERIASVPHPPNVGTGAGSWASTPGGHGRDVLEHRLEADRRHRQ
jgi:hypothetical protein